MPCLGIKGQPLLEPLWQGALSDYVTAIAWFPAGDRLAAASAAGEVFLLEAMQTLPLLHSGVEQSIDCLAISADGQFLAAAGQSGQVNVWRVGTAAPERVASLDQGAAWVDQMAWSPKRNQLAFSLGKYVQVWDAELGDIAATLSFDSSSVLSLTWHPDGDRLTVSGYQGVKIWNRQDWDDDPYSLVIPSASAVIAWSSDGKYIASGNLDRTITVLEWENPHPWVMRGFPGKIRQLAWSDLLSRAGAPLLASSSAQSVVVWERHRDESVGWEGRVLGSHDGLVRSLGFQPGTSLLASAGEEGCLMLWQKAARLAQTLEGVPAGFSALSWNAQGNLLAAGGERGELLIWEKAKRGQGFGR